MTNLKETTVKMNGRLKEHYTLKLVMRQEESLDSREKLTIRLKLIHDKDKGSKVELIKKQGVAKIFINNSLVAKQNVDIDTKYNDEIDLLAYSTESLLKYSLNLNIKGVLEINDDSKYIDTTEIIDSFILQAKQDKKLFIDLDSRESTTLVFCTLETTVEPDLLEYKTNFTDWQRMDVKQKNFSVVKNR